MILTIMDQILILFVLGDSNNIIEKTKTKKQKKHLVNDVLYD